MLTSSNLAADADAGRPWRAMRRAPALRKLAQRLWPSVHPDLFQRFPAQQAVNQRSMQELNALMDAASSPPPLPPPCMLRFFISGAEDDAPREISRRWIPPIQAGAASVETAAKRMERSVEACVQGLLLQLQLEPTPGEAREADANQARSQSDADEAGVDPLLRSAIRAAVLRAQKDSARHAGAAAGAEAEAEAEAEADTDAKAGGGEGRAGAVLREELVFFYEVPQEERLAATAWLRGLWPTHGMPNPHPPVIVHMPGAPPPRAALEGGFACVALRGAEAEAVRGRLLEAAQTAAAVHTRERSRAARAARGRCDALALALRCDAVEAHPALPPSVALRMAASLLAAVPQLRSALEAPWHGVSLRLWPAVDGAAVCEVSEVGDVGDGSDGGVRGGVGGGLRLEVRGDDGVAAAPATVRGAWRLLRAAARRREMLQELGARLRLAAVHAAPPAASPAAPLAAPLAAPPATAELGRRMQQQLSSLTSALALLRSEHVPLPAEAARERLSLSIGGTSAPQLLRGSRHAIGAPIAGLCLRMPSSFAPDELLQQLHLAAAAAAPGSRGMGSVRGSAPVRSGGRSTGRRRRR